MRAQNIRLESEITGMKLDEESRSQAQASHYETANEDLKKEMNEIRDQLAEKSESLSRHEKDVKTKQSIIDDVNE